jgi:hypothetical protein
MIYFLFKSYCTKIKIINGEKQSALFLILCFQNTERKK